MLYTLLVSFLSTSLFLIGMIKLGLRINLVDVPGGRKQHQGRVPLVGGIAMFLGVFSTFILQDIYIEHYYAFLLATGLLMIIGVIDDRHDISPKLRLLVQIIAMLIMIVIGQVLLSDLGNLLALGNISLGFIAISFTLFATLSLINAVNMMDGLDGLAGTLTFISLSLMFVVSIDADRSTDAQALFVAMSSVLAFLCFNFPLPLRKQAKVFMGDAGSLFLGGLLAWFSISLSQGAEKAVQPVIMLWFLAIPLLNLATVFTLRIKRKQSPLKPSRDHLHDYLINRGFSKRATVFLIILMSLIMGGLGLIGHYAQLPDYIMLLLFVFIYVYYLRKMLRPLKVPLAKS